MPARRPPKGDTESVQPNNRGLAPIDPSKLPEILSPSLPQTSQPLINATIVQVFVERGEPEQIERLMQADLSYNRDRLAIMREHSELHPDAIEERKDRAFRRFQYKGLMLMLPALLIAAPFVPLSASPVFIIMAIMIGAAVVINGRLRDLDLPGIVRIIETILKREREKGK